MMIESLTMDKVNFEPNDLILEERAFLHDMASPLMIAMGSLDLLKKKLKNLSPEETLDRMGKIHESLAKMSDLLKGRREFLVEKGERLKNSNTQ